MINTTVIILTKNEIESIEFTIDELVKNNFNNILVVDAGSTDGTLELVTQKKSNLLPKKIEVMALLYLKVLSTFKPNMFL